MGLRRFRIGNDLTVFWAINNRDGSPFDLEGRDVRLYMTHDKGREEVKAIISRLQDGTINNVIRWDFAGAEQRFLGEYKLTAEISESATKRVITKDHCEAFTLVSRSEMEDESLEANISIGGELIISSRLDIYRFEAVPVDVSALKVQIHEIQNDIEEINIDVGNINDDITNINNDIRTLRDAIQNFTPEIPDIDLSDYYTKKEIDVKVTAINNRIAIFEDWFKDDGNGNIKTTYDFYSTKTLAAGAVGSAGSGEGDGGGGSVNAISVDGVVYSPTDGIIDLSRAFANVEVDLSDYATKSALSSLQGEVDNIESVLGLSESASGYINTWNEVVAFLDGYSQSDDLATILSGINGNVTTLQGYFTEGIANKATADSSGNVITSTYAKQSTSIIAGSGLTGGGTLAADRTINVVSANDGITVNADNIQLNTVNTLTSTSTNKPLSAAQGKALSERIAVFEEWFKDDGSGNIKTTYNFYSTKAIAAGGAGTEGGGNAGGVALLTSWQNIPSSLDGYALGANLGVDLNSRVTTLEGKATAVSFAQTLTSGTAIGTITIDGTSKVLYAPSKLSQFEDDVVAGKYLPLSGGTIRGGVLEIDSSLGAYSFLRFKDRRINSSGYADNILKIIDADGNAHGALGLYGDSNGVLYYYLGCENDSYNGNNLRIYADKVSFGGSTILHSGNIGSYNAGSANILAKTYIENINYAAYTKELKLIAYDANWEANGFPANWTSGLSVMAGYVGWQLVVSGGSSDVPYFRKVSDSGVWSNWRALAFTDSNVASATKLQTPRTIWGQSFDGTGDVSGSLTGTNFLIMDRASNPYLKFTENGLNGFIQFLNGTIAIGPTSTKSLLVNNNGNVTIGGSDLAGTNKKLYVDGYIYTNGSTVYCDRDNGSNIAFCGSAKYGLGSAYEGALMYAYDSKPLYFYTGGVRMLINSSGNVLIGTTTDSGYKLDVNGTLRASGATTLSSTLSVTSTSTFTGKTTHNGGIGATSGTFSTTLGVTGATTLGSTLSVTGATTLKSTLGVTGATTLSSTLSVSGLLTASSGIKIAAGQSITFLDSSGNSHTLSYDSANKAFKFNGNAYATGQIAAGAAGSEEAGSGAVGGSEGAAGALEVDLYTLIGEEGTIAEGTLASVGLTQDALTGLLNGSYTKVVDLSYGVYNYIAYIHSNGYSIYIYRRENIMDDVGETYRITKSDSKYIVSYAEI